MRARWKTPEGRLSAGGLFVLAALFVLWWVKTPGVTVPGRLAALGSAGLFACACLRFVPVWTDFWRAHPRAPEAAPAREAEPPHMTARIFGAFLAADAGVIALVWLLRTLLGFDASPGAALSFWTCTDSAHYLDIARDWYLSTGDWDRLVQLVFLPGYPLAVRAMHLLVPNWICAGMAVSALSFAGAGCVLYRLLRLDFTHAAALRALKYACLLPGVFFYAAPMSESLFLLLCAGCVYCVRKKKWARGCLLGGLAAFTRSTGLLLLVPVFFELVSAAVRCGGKRAAAQFFALLLIPVGFGVYCWINCRVAGNPLQFMTYQRVHWGQGLGPFWGTAAYQLEYALRVDAPTLLGLWLPNLLCAFGALAVMLRGAKTLRASYTAWFLAYFLVAIGATWLLSGPRYLLVLPPLPMALAQRTERPAADRAWTAALGILSLLYACAFVLRWQVW